MGRRTPQLSTGRTPPDHDQLRGLVADLGVAGRPLVAAIDAVLDGGDLAAVVRRSGLPRRTVERLLQIGADAPSLRAVATVLGDRVVDQPTDAAVARMETLIGAAPKAQRNLDHVSATADTAARRATRLASDFVLANRRLVLVGDHDLTALAVAPLLPDTEIVVVDVDERLLDFIDQFAGDEGLSVTCVYADLTLSLPDFVAGSAHVVFTDPPYTPAGVATFLARAVEALHVHEPARIVMAYGFGPDQPALGVQVQRQIVGLELAVASIETGFNRYLGAQAIGSRSDLYTMIPTARSAKAASKRAAASNEAIYSPIYTHGERALESRARSLGHSAWEPVLAGAGITDAPPVDDTPRVGLASPGDGHPPAVLGSSRQLFDQAGQRQIAALAASLLHGADAWLGRLLIAARADRMALLVPNAHPDIADARSQAALRAVVAGKYELTFLRSQPTDRMAIVVAERTIGAGPSLIDRPTATLRTALHDSLYKGSRAEGHPLEKPAVTAVVDELLAGIGDGYGAVKVAELPRSVIARGQLALVERLSRPGSAG